MKTSQQTEIEQLKSEFVAEKETILQDFFTLLKFQSISSEAEYKSEINACANWVCTYLRNIGFKVDLWQTSGHPTIFASNLEAGNQQPTLLIYNHYDVQPVDPLELWKTPPFEPTIRNGEIFARGAQDNKGQLFYVLLALKKMLEGGKKLPINIKLCIEGEEECGSASLPDILKKRAKELKADYLAIVDLGIEKITKPAITLGLRGLVTMDLEVTSTHTDLHSGSHGGIAYNPIHALVKLLASVRDENGKITIAGFYKDCLPMSPEDKGQVSFDFDPAEYEKDFGAPPTGGEINFTPLERNWIRPTFEINGINGGYSGSGFKTVIPAKASAKISCRLVPNQDPHAIGALVEQHFKQHAPHGTLVKVHIHPGTGKATRADVNSPVAKAFAKAYSEVFNAPCQYLFSGASIPIVEELALASDAEVVLVGLGLPGDCIHAPNEHFGINRIELGFLTITRAIQLLKN